MEAEVFLFETCETMASFLGSTPLVRESWRLCSAANAAPAPPAGPGPGFVVDQIGSVGYIAFSGIQVVSGTDLHLEELVPVCGDGGGGGLFPALDCRGAGDSDGEEEPVMVHKGLLHLFFNMYASPDFQSQVKGVTEKSKSIVLTGHSIGGATASLMALSMLCCLETIPSLPATSQILCLTFGSPLLGNKSLSKALLRQRWAGNFCHVVSKHDIVPRLLFAPLASFNTQLHCLLQYWQLSMASPNFGEIALQIPDEDKSCLLRIVLDCTERRTSAPEKPRELVFWPCGSYMLCSQDGAICVDNAGAVLKLLHLMMATATPKSCVEDHLGYGDCVERVSWQLLQSRGFLQESLSESSYDAGMALALQSIGLGGRGSISQSAVEYLKMAKQMGVGLTPSLNSAKLAISLSKITPCRAQIEWYKASCDKSDDQMGYYDSFKRRQASKKDSKVNMFRLKLAQFWNDVIAMIDNNKLPHDFHKLAKWVNASHFYQLLVEPLDIADYYRSSRHLSNGHYLKHGRERRHRIIDKWWRGRSESEEENQKRSKFAGLTQDPCFWAKLEEARELLEKVRRERSSAELWKGIEAFERYSREMVESKEVSKDVLAKNSSYSLWVEELGELRSQILQFPALVTGFVDGKIVP